MMTLWQQNHLISPINYHFKVPFAVKMFPSLVFALLLLVMAENILAFGGALELFGRNLLSVSARSKSGLDRSNASLWGPKKLFINSLQMNKKPIPYGPFFQGWLTRMVDHSQNMSVIVIAGSFSASSYRNHTQHYIYCAVDRKEGTIIRFAFPNASDISISEPVQKQKLDVQISWKDHGYLKFNDSHSVINLSLDDSSRISIVVNGSVPWSRRLSFGGPEGWLGLTKLLPCRYYIHSLGSPSSYTMSVGGYRMDGEGFSHIESNYGSFFPEGWVWAQAVDVTAGASLSLVGGKFAVGPISPLSFVLCVRRKNGESLVFRSIDMDTPDFDLDGVNRTVVLQFKSFLKGASAALSIESSRENFHSVFVPTRTGFSATPGCKETYKARAKLRLVLPRQENEVYEFPLTALEFGGSFIDRIIGTNKASGNA